MFKSMKQYVNFIARLHKDKTAIRYVEGTEVISKTFSQFCSEIEACAAEIQFVCGDISGKHISVVSTYDYQYIVTLLAIVYANGVAIPFNIQESRDVISEELKTVDTDIIVSDLPTEKLETYDVSDYYIVNRDSLFVGDKKAGYTDFKSREKGCFMLFTSGSTGKNKAVITSLKSIFSPIPHNGWHIFWHRSGLKKIGVDLKKGYSLFNVMPAYHISGLAVLFICTFMGFTINYSFKPQYMYRELAKMPSDAGFVLPVVLKMWAKDIKKGNIDKLGGIKTFVTGAAPLDNETIEVFKDARKHILFGYGMTETSGITALNLSFDFNKMGSVGRAFAGDKIKIKDGEVIIHLGRKFQGYYNMPECEEFKDGWLYTGDLGHFEGKYLYLTGRKKNLIILSSGENVSPEELENILYKSEYVKEAVVTGENDMIVATIYCKPDDRDEIKAFVKKANEELPIYKRIKRTVFLDVALPKTATGKIKR